VDLKEERRGLYSAKCVAGLDSEGGGVLFGSFVSARQFLEDKSPTLKGLF